MRHLLQSVATTVAVAGLASCLILAGCEKGGGGGSNDPDQPVINPHSATIVQGQSVTFSVSGGHTLSWGLTKQGWGILQVTAPDTVVYTSTYTPQQNGLQMLSVTSSDPQNPAVPVKTDEVLITHQGANSLPSNTTTTTSTTTTSTTTPSTTTTTVGTLQVEPPYATIDIGRAGSFGALGGNPPYHWSVNRGGLGSVNPSSGPQTLYLATTSGVNTVICTDSSGQNAFATVTTPP